MIKLTVVRPSVVYRLENNDLTTRVEERNNLLIIVFKRSYASEKYLIPSQATTIQLEFSSYLTVLICLLDPKDFLKMYYYWYYW